MLNEVVTNERLLYNFLRVLILIQKRQPEVLGYMSQRIWNLLEGVILIYVWMALNAAGLNYLGKDKRVS